MPRFKVGDTVLIINADFEPACPGMEVYVNMIGTVIGNSHNYEVSIPYKPTCYWNEKSLAPVNEYRKED